jgi:NAD(P)-dependent dehydrogenase (short-subunit alcohol dehydrogenase family)
VVSALAGRGAVPIVLDRHLGDTPVDYAKTVDLSDTEAAHAAVESFAANPGIDAVVTCAGIDHPGTLEKISAQQWEEVVRVNLFGTVAVIRAALPSLLAGHGRIVTIASTLGHGAVSDATAYCASKWGVVGFSRALMVELRGRVGVTMLTPGGMSTHFFDGRDEQYRPGPDAKLADPSSVADAVCYALAAPADVEIRELVVASPFEPTWP